MLIAGTLKFLNFDMCFCCKRSYQPDHNGLDAPRRQELCTFKALAVRHVTITRFRCMPYPQAVAKRFTDYGSKVATNLRRSEVHEGISRNS